MSKDRSSFKRKSVVVGVLIFVMILVAITIGACDPPTPPPTATETPKPIELTTAYYFAASSTGSIKPTPQPDVSTQDLNIAFDIIANTSNAQSNLLFLLDESNSVGKKLGDHSEASEKLHRLPWKIVEMLKAIESDGLDTPNIGVHVFGVGHWSQGQGTPPSGIFSPTGIYELAGLGRPSQVLGTANLEKVLQNDDILPSTSNHHFLNALQTANAAFPSGEGNILVIITDGRMLVDTQNAVTWQQMLDQINDMRNSEKKISFLWYILDDGKLPDEIDAQDPNRSSFDHGNFEIIKGEPDQFLRNLLAYPSLEKTLPEVHGWVDPQEPIKKFSLNAYVAADLGHYDFDPDHGLVFRRNGLKVDPPLDVTDTCSDPDPREIQVETTSKGYGFYWAKPIQPTFGNLRASISHAVNEAPAYITIELEHINSDVIETAKLRCAVKFSLSSESAYIKRDMTDCNSGSMNALCQDGNHLFARWEIRMDGFIGEEVPIELDIVLPGVNPQTAPLKVNVYSWPQLYPYPDDPFIISPSLPITQTVQYTAKFRYAITDPVVVTASSLGSGLKALPPIGDELLCPAETGENICDDSPESYWQCDLKNEDGLLLISITTQKYVISYCKFDIWNFSFMGSPSLNTFPAVYECNNFDCK